MSAARVFYSLKSSRCVESCRVKVSAQPLHVFSNVIESDQRAEEHARADQLGNTSTRISHDIGPLGHSLNHTISETRPCTKAVKPIVKAMRHQRAAKRSSTTG
jgi:hypothetical protein